MDFGTLELGFGTRQGGPKSAAQLFAERSVILDFENDEFFWNGAARTIGDLTSNANGYTKSGIDWFGSDYTILFDYTIDQAASAAGTILTIAGTPATNRRFEFGQYHNNYRRFYTFQANPSQFLTANGEPVAVSLGLKGRTRRAAAVSLGAPTIVAVENYKVQAIAGANATTAVAATQIFIGYQYIVSAAGKFNGTIHAIHVWPRKLSDSELHTITTGGNGAGYPLHIIGDSYANDNIMSQFVKDEFTQYIAMSNDAGGGQNMTQHAARFAATPQYYDSTLVILEGGLDVTGVDAVASINDMIGRLSHSRFLICEPVRHASLTPESPDRAGWDALWATVTTAFPDNIIETFDALADGGDDSTEDNQDIADGLCPRSLRSDDIHLTEAGSEIYAGQIAATVIAKGWAT